MENKTPKILIPNINNHSFIQWVTRNKTNSKAEEHEKKEEHETDELDINEYGKTMQEFKTEYLNSAIDDWLDVRNESKTDSEKKDCDLEIQRLQEIKDGKQEMSLIEAAIFFNKFYKQYNSNNFNNELDNKDFPVCELEVQNDELLKKLQHRFDFVKQHSPKELHKAIDFSSDNNFKRLNTSRFDEDGVKSPTVYEMKWRHIEHAKHRVYFMLKDNNVVLLHHGHSTETPKQNNEIEHAVNLARFIEGISPMGERTITPEEQKLFELKIKHKKKKSYEHKKTNKKKAAKKMGAGV